jgi:hypothetical protein
VCVCVCVCVCVYAVWPFGCADVAADAAARSAVYYVETNGLGCWVFDAVRLHCMYGCHASLT